MFHQILGFIEYNVRIIGHILKCAIVVGIGMGLGALFAHYIIVGKALM